MKCKVDNCDREAKYTVRQICHAHYARWYQYGDYKEAFPINYRKAHNPCTVPGCERRAKNFGKNVGFCEMHAQRIEQYGSAYITKIPHFEIREVITKNNVCHLTLSDGSAAICSVEDRDLAESHNWVPVGVNRAYVGTNIKVSEKPSKYKTAYLHRMIMERVGELGEKDYVDHINRDPRDNRRSNLRIATPSMNIYNTGRPCRSSSGYFGVYWHKNNKSWYTRVAHKNNILWCKSFDNKREAAIERDRNLVKLRGPVISPTSLNFPGRFLEWMEEFGHITCESKK